MIQVYSENNKNYSSNGDMTLLPEDAYVSVKLNGSWNLTMQHPIDKKGRWKYLEEGAVIKIPSFNGEQLFRIYKKEKSEGGTSVEAYPIFFDSKNDCFLTDTRPTGKNGQEALNIMLAPNKKYSAQSDIARKATAYYEYMNLMEAINGDNANSFLNRWDGEILYDNFKIIVNERVGGDYGVELRYGKNIPANGITETVDMSEVVTRIYPKSYNGYKLSGNGYVDSPILSNYPTVKAATMKFDNIKMREDAQEDDEEKGIVVCDTQADLDRALTEACKKQFESGLDKPKVTIEADMVLLQNTDQYKDYEILETVSLGDTIHCRHDKLGIISDARVVGLEYDCILNRVISVVLGQFQSNYIDHVTSSVDKIDSVIDSDGDIMAERIKGLLDGMSTQLRLQSTVAKKVKGRAFTIEDLDPDSPLFGCMTLGTQGFQIANRRTADNRDWDWRTAATANGFFADAIVTGTLADRTGTNYWDLDKGIFKIASKSLSVDGQSVEQIAQAETEKKLIKYAESVTKSLQNLQEQVDGQVEDWYYDYEPTINNLPASVWTTQEEKEKHIGDRFFWKSKGYAYRFMQDNTEWKWVLLKDTDITTALKNAADAKDIADGKRRTFLQQPVPPYDVGDLWMDGTNILACVIPKVKDGIYAASDWSKLNKYPTKTEVETLIQATEKEILITAKQNAKDYVDGKLVNYSTSAQIKVETDQIKQTVSKKVDGSKVISAINQSAETIKIQAKRLDLTGYATFYALGTAGQTVINGANISTGNINCDRLNGGVIRGQKIIGGTMSGTFVSGGRVSADGLEVYGDTGIGQPYIDFHRDASANDYSARILEQSAGNLIVYNKIANVSDRRLKKDIVELDDRFLNLFEFLTPKQYRFKNGDEMLNLGFIAQELDEAMERIGITDKPIVIRPSEPEPKTGDWFYALNYDDFIAILWKKIQQIERRLKNGTAA